MWCGGSLPRTPLPLGFEPLARKAIPRRALLFSVGMAAAFVAPVLGSKIWTPKRSPTNVVFLTFSVHLQRAQTKPSMLAETLERYLL